MDQDKRFAVGAALPFSTTDVILAQCLRIAGIQETPWSPRHIYTEDILFKAGGGVKDESGQVIRKSRFAGLSLWQAAKAAWSSKPLITKGRVEHHFEHSRETAYLVEAYRDQEKIVKEGDGDAAEAIREIMRKAAGRIEPGETVMDEREALLRILCVALKTRIQYANRWKEVVPILHIKENRKKETDGTGNRKTERYLMNDKFVPLNAPDETLKKMGLI